jgi:hypothetical protein
MKLFKIAFAAILLAGCGTSDERRHDALMSRIEQTLQLPQGASQIEEYARYYAETDTAEITAVYLIPFDDAIGPNDVCEEVLADFSTREAPCPDLRPAWAMPAGQRRWVDDPRKLPMINDGGCSVIEVVFDPATSRVTRAECNGEA